MSTRRTDDDDAYLRRLGSRILSARLRQGLTQEALAELAGISRNFVSELERGRRSCAVLVLARVARALGVTVGSLADDP